MKLDVRSYISIAIAILFILPILAITPIYTQIIVATIRGVSSPAYPGRPVNITIDVGLATTVTIRLCSDASCTNVWNQQTFVPPQPGIYNLSLVLPKLLQGARDDNRNGMIDLYVVVSTVFGTDSQIVDVAPLIEVIPVQTANVNPDGSSKSVTVNFYGFIPGDTITAVTFDGPVSESINVQVNVGSDGSASTTISLLDITDGYGLPRGTYTVSCTATRTNTAQARNGALIIVPQVIVYNSNPVYRELPTEGHGRCELSNLDRCESYNIVIEGYGFDPEVSVLRIDLRNLNFTNVVYSNTSVGVLTNEYGHFRATNLFRTNMSAGIYIPIVYTTQTDEFRNVGYIVRPLLTVVAPTGVLLPGDSVTIAAYGYGPGAPYYPGYNTLEVYWEKVRLLRTVSLGKDGNATFVIEIPGDATFGIHYIYGVDAWKPLPYEYTLAIVIGAKAVWSIPPLLPEEPYVSAGYNNEHIRVCTCRESEKVAGTGYCGKCVTYPAEICDYLGDYIEVTVYGLSPGETLNVTFGEILVLKNVKANSSVETLSFVVPTVPEGTYQITVVGSVSGTIYVTDYMFLDRTTNTRQIARNTLPKVVPKILLLDLEKDVLPILVGPGFVRVIGTGFTPGISVRAVLFNGTDAAYMLNMQVQTWSIDTNGVLRSPFTEKAGIYVPVLEPGVYEVSLVYIEPGAEPGKPPKVSKAGFVYVVNNVSRLATGDKLDSVASQLINKMDNLVSNVANTLDAFQRAVSSKLDSVASDLKSKMDAVSTGISTIGTKLDSISSQVNSIAGTVSSVASDVSSIKSDVGSIKSSVNSIANALSDLQNAVSTIKNAADTINTNVGRLSTTLDSISRAVGDVSSKVDIVSGKVDSISGKIDGVSTAVRDISGKVDALSGKVNDVANKVDTVSGKVDNVSSAVNNVGGKLDTASKDLGSKIDSATSTLQTYIIIALVLALIGAAASIYAVIQLGRKLAG